MTIGWWMHQVPIWSFDLLQYSFWLREEKEVMAEPLRNYGQLLRVVDYFPGHMEVLFLHVEKPRSGWILFFLKTYVKFLPYLYPFHIVHSNIVWHLQCYDFPMRGVDMFLLGIFIVSSCDLWAEVMTLTPLYTFPVWCIWFLWHHIIIIFNMLEW